MKNQNKNDSKFSNSARNGKTKSTGDGGCGGLRLIFMTSHMPLFSASKQHMSIPVGLSLSFSSSAHKPSKQCFVFTLSDKVLQHSYYL